MKYFALLFLVGLSAASLSIPNGNLLSSETDTQLEFEYKGRLLSGLPELSSQYAGLGMKCRVKLQVQTERRFAMVIENPTYVRVSDKLESVVTPSESWQGREQVQEGESNVGETNWRKVKLPAFTPVPESLAEKLRLPVTFAKLKNGEIETLTIEKDDLQWSVNFKKAMATLFQTKIRDTLPTGVESNRIQRSEEESAETSSFWKVKEMALDGICDMWYQVNEIPTYAAKKMPRHLVPKPELCEGKKMYEVVKSKDVNSCERRATYNFYKPGSMKCPQGNCDDSFSRSATTRYVVCGEGNERIVQSIVNEGEFHQNLVGLKTEKFLTGTLQELKLVDRQRISHHIREPRNPMTLTNLMFEYTVQNAINSEEVGQVNSNRITGNIRTVLFDHKIKRNKMESEEVTSEIEQIIKKLVNEDMETNVDLAQKQIPLKVLNVARGFGMIRLPKIEHLYNTLKNEFEGERKQVFKNIFFDALIMSGSTDSFMFIQDLIEKREMSDIQITSMFMFMPTYILTPTESLLERIFDVVSSEHIRSKHNLHKQAIMSLATLVNHACLSDERKTSYPTNIYGDFCHPESPVVVNRLIPYLHKIMQRSEKQEELNMAIVTLGLLEHKNVIPIILPILEKTQSKTTSLNRYLAVYSLQAPGVKHRELVTPLLMSVFSNPSETTELRLAAFKVIMSLKPSMTVMQKIATSTWQEKDVEILKAINTAFYSLQNNVVSPQLKKKALLLYPLIKKVNGILPSTGVVFTSDRLSEFGVEFKGLYSWLSSKDSLMPRNVYAQDFHKYGSYEVVPYKMGLRQTGLATILDQMTKVGSGIGSNEELEGSIKKQLSGEWREVIQNLGIQSRGAREGGASGALFVSVFQNTPFFRSFQYESSEVIQEKIKSLLEGSNNIKSQLEGEHAINFQRVIDFSPSDFAIPSDMGFPIVVEMHTPVTVGVKGHMNVDLSSSMIPSFRMKVKSFATWHKLTTVGTICPFTEEDVLTGVDDHTVINVPAEISASLNIPNQKLSVSLKPLSEISRDVDIVHTHVRPFTVATKSFGMTPATLESSFKVMKSDASNKVKVWHIGEYIGLNMKSVLSTESHFPNMRGVWEIFRMYNYNPLNILHFGIRSSALTKYMTPSIRTHIYRLNFNPQESSTKEITLNFKLGVATKEIGESVKYHSIVIDKSSSSNQLNSILPFKKISKPINEHEGHEERRSKLQHILSKSSVEEGSAVTVKYSVVLSGSRHRTFTYTATLASGESLYKSKWNLELESEHSQRKICIDSKSEMPRLPLWKISEIQSAMKGYQYDTVIGFGSTCEESKIKVIGTAKTSEQQKQFSRESAEAKLLHRMKQERSSGVVELSEVADQVRRQATTLDELDYNIEYVNVPEKVTVATDRVFDLLKVISWTTSSRKNNMESSERQNEKITVKVKFNTKTQTVNFVFIRPTETVQIDEVYVPYPVNYFFPRVAQRPGSGIVKDVVKSITGKSLYPLCKLENGQLSTYDNLTSSVKIDDCFHLLTADCSISKSFGVLVRSKKSSGEEAKELKIYLHKTEIVLTPSEGHSRYSTSISVHVNGERIETRRGEKIAIKDSKQDVISKVEEFEDGSIELKSSYLNIRFDGSKIEVEGPLGLKNRLCGLCGDNNNQKVADLRGPGQCIYSKSEIVAASYRVSIPSHSCSPLERQVGEELRRETETCNKYTELPTKVIESFKLEGGPCTIHEHEILERPSELCFSRYPVTECGIRCKPRDQRSIVHKRVSLTCMDKESRLAKHYAEKIRAGKVIPELANLPEVMAVNLPLPITCEPINRGI